MTTVRSPVITLDRPQARNAQNTQMTYELNDAFTRAAYTDSVKCIVLAGTSTLRETIDASLREVVNSTRRLELMALIQQDDGFDREVVERAWGGSE